MAASVTARITVFLLLWSSLARATTVSPTIDNNSNNGQQRWANMGNRGDGGDGISNKTDTDESEVGIKGSDVVRNRSVGTDTSQCGCGVLLSNLSEIQDVFEDRLSVLENRSDVFENRSESIGYELNETVKNIRGELFEVRKRTSQLEVENEDLRFRLGVVVVDDDYAGDGDETPLSRVEDTDSRLQSAENITWANEVIDRLTDLENISLVEIRNRIANLENTTLVQMRNKIANLEKKLEISDSEKNILGMEILSLTAEMKKYFKKCKRRFKKDMRVQRIELKDELIDYVENITRHVENAVEEKALMEPGMNKILLFPRMKDTFHSPFVLNLHRNDLQTYRRINISSVVTAVYVPSLYGGGIMFSSLSPIGIFYVRMKKSNVKTIRLNVISHGMAVDAKNDFIFLSTTHPASTISRMTLRGKHFRGIVRTSGASGPYGVAVDAVSKNVYFCQKDKLSMSDYEGKNMEVLVRGSGIYTVAVDAMSGYLFYGSDGTLMRRSKSKGETTELVKDSGLLWKILLYNNTLYTVNYNGSDVSVVYLDNNVAFPLQSIPSGQYDIVLIP